MFFIGKAIVREIVSAGDLASRSWDKNDFITDGNYHDLDVSSVVPIAAKIAVFRIRMNSATAGHYCEIRPKGYTNGINIFRSMVMVANKPVDNEFSIVLPSDNILEYEFSNGTLTFIDLDPIYWIL